MSIYQPGALNTASLVVPDIYVQIIPPSVAVLNGVPTNILGVVGTATWGPVGAPTVVASYADYATKFGNMQNRKYDMGSHVAAAVLQGASNFRCVRVTDTTDVAATILVQSTCITFTSRYTGSGANLDTVSIAPGSAVGTFKAIVGRPGLVPEVFDNIGLGLTANALWIAIAAAINLGTSASRGPSALIIATAGAGTTAPATATYTLTGGTDGATTITSTVLLGVDTTSRTGMYSLRGTGASVALLADNDTSASWPTQVTYGLSEGTYMIMTGPAGETISSAATNKATAGIDSYAAKLLVGDWIYFNDTVNGTVRMISPQGFVAGNLANLAPQNSGLNKQIYGVVATQKTLANQLYSSADLQLAGQASLDLVTNPVPGGAYFGVRFGRNSSSNANIHGDNYTRMTNFIAATINQGIGGFIGKLGSSDAVRQAQSTISSFFDNLWQQGMIGAADGSIPYSVVMDITRLSTGYLVANVKVVFLSVIENFIVNVEGGQTVTITRTNVQLAA